jgi:hypothetical protein
MFDRTGVRSRGVEVSRVVVPVLTDVRSVRPPARHAVPGVSTVVPGIGRLRLTRRGLVVLGGLLSLVVGSALAGGVLLVSGVARASADDGRSRLAYRVVMPGETLWGIAGEVAPGVDRRRTVALIVEVNALPGAGVVAGQRLAVPVEG